MWGPRPLETLANQPSPCERKPQTRYQRGCTKGRLHTITHRVIILGVIQSFDCEETRKVFGGKVSRRLPQDLLNVMQRKLRMLDAAVKLVDLKIPPNNHLEALKDDRRGQHSIRVNRQWRLCFRWTENGPSNVEMVDYH